MLMLAVFEIMFFPIMYFKCSFGLLWQLFLMISGVVIMCATFIFIKQNVVLERVFIDKKLDIRAILLIGVIGLIALYVSWGHYEAYDDGYYVAVSNIALEENKIVLNDNMAYTGDSYFAESCTRPTINSWELLIACFCKMTAVPAAVAHHTLLPLLMVPLFMAAALTVFRKVCKNSSEIYLAMWIYLFLYVFFDKSMQLISPYSTVGTSNGKTIMWYLIFPLVLRNGIELFNNTHKRSLWLSFALLPLAAICGTATAVYTIPLYYITFGIPYIILRIVAKDKHIIATIGKMAICMIPVSVFGIYSLINISGTKATWAEHFSFNYVNLMKDTFRDSFLCIGLFVLGLLLIIVWGRMEEVWKFFVSKTVMLILTVFNPLTAKYVAEYITGNPVYDRLFLLFSAIFVIPIGFVYCFRIAKGVWRKIVPVLAVACVLLQGWSYNTFIFYAQQSPHQNAFMIKNEVMEVVDYFDEAMPEGEIRMLGDYTINRFFRQCSSRYRIVVGRYDIIPRNNISQLYFDSYDEVFVNKKVSEKSMMGLDYFKVDYLVTIEPIDAQDKFRLVFKSNNEKVYVYKRN